MTIVYYGTYTVSVKYRFSRRTGDWTDISPRQYNMYRNVQSSLSVKGQTLFWLWQLRSVDDELQMRASFVACKSFSISISYSSSSSTTSSSSHNNSNNNNNKCHQTSSTCKYLPAAWHRNGLVNITFTRSPSASVLYSSLLAHSAWSATSCRAPLLTGLAGTWVAAFSVHWW